MEKCIENQSGHLVDIILQKWIIWPQTPSSGLSSSMIKMYLWLSIKCSDHLETIVFTPHPELGIIWNLGCVVLFRPPGCTKYQVWLLYRKYSLFAYQQGTMYRKSEWTSHNIICQKWIVYLKLKVVYLLAWQKYIFD